MADSEKSEEQKSKEDKLSGWDEAAHDVPTLPKINIERDFVIAKSYLQQIGCRNETVWGHLNDIINHVLKERPPDCMRYFEDMSRELRITKFFLNKECDSKYKELEEEPKEVDDTTQLLRFYRRVECLYESAYPYEDKFGTQDFFPIFKLLEEAGVGFPYSDMYNIQMGMRLLAKTKPIGKLKFWGKVLGTVRDYIVIEAELTPEAMGERLRIFTEHRVSSEIKERGMNDLGSPPGAPLPGEEQEPFFKEEIDEEEFVEYIRKRKLDLYVKPPLPVAIPPQVSVVPAEEPGQGVNRKVYYVSNDPYDSWHELPDVTPEHIVKARMMRRFLTGILNSEVPGYPTFPGTEKEFLRAQIARITHTTHSSPLGFYSSSGEEEAVEIEEGELYTENADYQPLPVRDLMDATFEFWVHHEQYILNQGRTQFWRENPEAPEDEMDETEGYEREVERGPPILSTLSGDVMTEPTPCWTLRKASTLLGEDTVVVLKSNLWPGAFTALKDRLFVNFYVGWATKSSSLGFNPYLATNIASEYELGPEIMEMTDPTVEMEEFRWLQLHPKIVPMGALEEEEAGEHIDEEDAN